MTSPSMDQQRLADLQNVIRADIKAGLYHGAVIKVARAGEVALEAAIGAADAAQTQPLALNSVFSIFSVTKAFTNVLVLRAIEQGRFALTTPICDLIPEFSRLRTRKDPDLAPAVAPGRLPDHLRGQAGLVHRSLRGDLRDRHRGREAGR